MYSTCLFCKQPLGTNEIIEQFPVGRRIAFDAGQGRLWVVCKACERWNLSPLDDRLEIIDECERLFSNTRMRVSTENIGLARLSEGLELVRIGRPMRPEMAAWRYGDQFGRRRRNMYWRVGAGVVAIGAIYGGTALAGATIGGFWGFGGLYRRVVHGSKEAVVANVPVSTGRLDVKRKHLAHVALIPDAGDSWRVHIPTGRKNVVELTGEEARRATSLLLPPINKFGGSQTQVSSAVNLLDVAGDPLYFVASVARHNDALGSIQKMQPAVRLAIEMASHEEAERRALEGELKALELAWKEAEEVAAISDSLFTPISITAALNRLRGKL